MRAIVHDTYGSADVLRLDDIAAPVAGKGEVLVRISAAGVDRGVWHLMEGKPYVARLGLGLRRPRNRVLGFDLAGRVEALGEGVSGFEVGDEVLGIGRGTFAELACAPAAKLVHKPASLAVEQAAALSISGLTALQALRDAAGVQPGQHVLVIGAGGGVGSFAVQIAKVFGAEVTAVCSTGKVDLVRSLGADHVVDYTRQQITDPGVRYDAVVDIGGNRSLSELRRVLTPKGALVIVGGEHGGRWLGGLDRNLRATVLSAFVGQRLRAPISRERGPDIEELVRMVEDGTVSPVIDRTYPLADAPDALRHLAAGSPRGKLVVTI